MPQFDWQKQFTLTESREKNVIECHLGNMLLLGIPWRETDWQTTASRDSLDYLVGTEPRRPILF